MSNPQDSSHKIMTIPNVLSMLRLCMVPLFIYLYVVRKDYTGTLIVLAVSGLTDIVDGKIARHFHQVSEFGKIIDPVADKITQAAILFCLTTRFHHMLIPFAIMAVKEPLMSVTGIQVIQATGHVHGAEWYGKVNTVLMFIMYILHLLWPGIPGLASDIIIGVVSAFMVFSLVMYMIRNRRICLEAEQAKAGESSKEEKAEEN